MEEGRTAWAVDYRARPGGEEQMIVGLRESELVRSEDGFPVVYSRGWYVRLLSGGASDSMSYMPDK